VAIADVLAAVQAALDASTDPDQLRHNVLRTMVVAEPTWRPGDPPPDQSLDARWRRVLAADPESILRQLQATGPSASVRILERTKREVVFTLPNNEGEIHIKFIPGKGLA
jgi:hypothetical protein